MDRKFVLFSLAGIGTFGAIYSIKQLLITYCKQLLPLSAKKHPLFKTNEDFSRLTGLWYLYWPSFDMDFGTTPVWFRGICQFEVVGNSAKGFVKLINHPYGDVHFIQKGEIRDNKLLLVDVCVEDPTEFATIIYPDISEAGVLLGMWSGFDNLSRPVTGPNVMSKTPLTGEDLDQLMDQHEVTIIPPGRYRLG